MRAGKSPRQFAVRVLDLELHQSLTDNKTSFSLKAILPLQVLRFLVIASGFDHAYILSRPYTTMVCTGWETTGDQAFRNETVWNSIVPSTAHIRQFTAISSVPHQFHVSLKHSTVCYRFIRRSWICVNLNIVGSLDTRFALLRAAL